MAPENVETPDTERSELNSCVILREPPTETLPPTEKSPATELIGAPSEYALYATILQHHLMWEVKEYLLCHLFDQQNLIDSISLVPFRYTSKYPGV